MTFGLGFLLALAALVVAASIVAARSGRGPATGSKPSRPGGLGPLALEELVSPRVEHVVEARQEQRHDDLEPSGDDPEARLARIKADLRASLAHQAVDTEEVRRHLASALREGLDWRALYDESTRAEVADRPFRAPQMPPSSRVAPHE